MATYTLSGNVTNLLGAQITNLRLILDARAVDYGGSSFELSEVPDPETNTVRLGGPVQVKVGADGSFSLDLLGGQMYPDSTDPNGVAQFYNGPAYTLRATYADAHGVVRVWQYGPLQLTTDVEIAPTQA